MNIRTKIMFLTITLCLILPAMVYAGQSWEGTDDLVDRKMTEVAGISAREPLIDISEGNLGLFIFAAGGFLAGSICGYQWRKIFSERAGNQDG